jgi:hypothetical protein
MFTFFKDLCAKAACGHAKRAARRRRHTLAKLSICPPEYLEQRLVLSPVANNDTYNNVGPGSMNVSATNGVLANDTGTGLTAHLVSSPMHMSNFQLNSDGSFSGTDTTFWGTDQFTYYDTDSNNQRSNNATTTSAATTPPSRSTTSSP